MVKITLQDDYTTATLERSTEDPDIYTMIDLFRDAALALSYQQVSWENAILQLASEIKSDRAQRMPWIEGGRDADSVRDTDNIGTRNGPYDRDP